MRLRLMSPSRLLRVLLFGMMAASLAVLAVLTAQVSTELRAFQQDPVDNIHWNITQLELDLVRLQSEVDLALIQPHRPLAELRLRYDLFYSRTDTLQSGVMFERLGLDETLRPMAGRLQAFLERSTPLIDGPDAALRQAMSSMAFYINDLRRDLRHMAVQVIDDHARVADQRRAELTQLLSRIAWATLVLLVVLAALLASVSSLNRQAERQRAEAQRVSSRLQATVSAALDAVIVAGMDGRVQDFNQAAERIFGYSRAEALGQPLEALIVPPRHAEAHRNGMARMRATGRMNVVDAGRIQITAIRKSGEEFPVELSIASNAGPDGLIFISYLRDISRRLADEKALLAARDGALAAEKAKTTFLAVMSHEMRTPLNGVMAALGIARRRSTDEKQARFLDIAQSSAQQLLRHVNDVLDISKVETGNMALADETFELVPMIEPLVEALRPAARAKRTRIDLAALSDLPALRGDAFRLGQIVQNLLSNAIKFTEDGIISVEVEEQERHGQTLTLELRVTDTGIGIAADDLARVFDDFVMLDPSYGREVGGTGLGLAISRRLAQAMGGTMGVESEPGKGSCFWLRLPLRIASDDAEDPAHDTAQPAAASQSHTPGSALDLLVVEDNATNRIVLEEMLSHLGHRVTLACDGAQGVALARAHRYDAVLMDISMPVMDGLTATRLIRDEGRSRRSRVIAVTAHTMPEELARFRAAGMDAALTKPISPQDLRRVLAETAPGPAPPPPEALLDQTRLQDLHAALGPQGLARAITRFLADGAETLARLHAATTAETRAALCHDLAGSAAMVGAAGLHLHFARLESLCRNGDQSAVPLARDTSQRLWDETARALELQGATARPLRA
jgi:PAS domain S-box-containing protein